VSGLRPIDCRGALAPSRKELDARVRRFFFALLGGPPTESTRDELLALVRRRFAAIRAVAHAAPVPAAKSAAAAPARRQLSLHNEDGWAA
jgi:hypothetical protein